MDARHILLVVVLAVVVANALNKCPLWPAVLVLALLQLWSGSR